MGLNGRRNHNKTQILPTSFCMYVHLRTTWSKPKKKIRDTLSIFFLSIYKMKRHWRKEECDVHHAHLERNHWIGQIIISVPRSNKNWSTVSTVRSSLCTLFNFYIWGQNHLAVLLGSRVRVRENCICRQGAFWKLTARLNARPSDFKWKGGLFLSLGGLLHYKYFKCLWLHNTSPQLRMQLSRIILMINVCWNPQTILFSRPVLLEIDDCCWQVFHFPKYHNGSNLWVSP